MRVHVKICGITDPDAVTAAVEAGADAVGFVFADSPRQVTPAQASALSAAIPGGVERFAVFLRPGPDVVTAVLGQFPADVVQADQGSVVVSLADFLPVFRVGEAHLLERRLDGTVDSRFMYEGRRSGVGESVDWRLARRLARMGRMTLAGGLSPENVADAIREVGPYAVDVSSGVETRPGVKDPGKIRDFVAAVRDAEKEMVTG